MKGINLKSWRAGRLRAHILPILVWAGTVAGVVVLFHHRVQRFEVLGIAQGEVRQIAANCDGRLKSVPVQLFEKVSQGQTLAVIDTVLDDEHVQAELATALAEVHHLMAQLVPTQERLLTEAANLETDKIAAQRRFSVDVENARLRILELMTLLETDRIMLEELAVEVKIVRSLLDQNAIAPYELQKVEVQYNTLAKKIEENEHLLEQAKQDLGQAQERRDEFAQRQPQHPSVDSTLEVIRKAVRVQEQRIDELLARRVPLVLKSPFDGLVSQVLRRPGGAILAGEPILTVAEAEPREIIAYASEDQLGWVRERMAVELIKNGEPAQIASSQVAYLGPTMELMPERLWRNPNIPQWGRPVLIRIPPSFKLVPGELVGIRGL